ncbi:MAG: glycosyltransferase family 39 protein [Oscillatoria sp. SIO1A7]|nr:glycosyltransferase family 39 protein [Oscillatoria sp. SIO1A7]
MYREIFRLDESDDRSRRTKHWLEQVWVLGLLLAAILLYQMNLGSLPLRDWDEGTVAQVARELWRGDWNWLHPTLYGEPYWNKPPAIHLLIALAYSIGGVSELTTRLPGAMLCALSVPLLYGIGREVFLLRGPAIFSALVYLTLLPVVRHGRLGMLDGGVLCFFLLTIWSVLRARRDLRYGLAAGIGLGLLCLTKGILGLLLGAIAAVFIIWDTPRLLRSLYLWSGLILGMAPAIAWYSAQWLHYGEPFLHAHFLNQSFGRIVKPVENNYGPPWYYLLEILKYGFPWLLFWPQGLRLAWENRLMGWGKLVLAWTSIYLLAISAMGTKLPWYVLPLYPALALACGAQLALVWQGEPYKPLVQRPQRGIPLDNISPDKAQRSTLYPRAWVAILALLALAGCGFGVYFAIATPSKLALLLTLAAFGLTMTTAAILVYCQDRQFILVLFWGMYVSLSLFVSSYDWLWELGEDYPVKPVAAIVSETPPGTTVYTSHPNHRPSLNFYSDRRVIPKSNSDLQELWEIDPPPYFLIDRAILKDLKLKEYKQTAAVEDWILVTR